MDRAIARDQSGAPADRRISVLPGLLSRASCPAHFLVYGIWIKISSRAKLAVVYFTSLDSGAWPRPAVRLGWGTFILGIGFYSIPKLRKLKPFATLVRMAHVGTLGRRRDPPLVVEHLSVALAYCPAIIRCA